MNILDSAAAVYSRNTGKVVISRIDFVCCILRQILQNFEGQAENTQFINDILENLNLIATEISTSFLNLGCFPSSPAVISFESPPVHQHSQRGHPKFEITKEALIGLREIGHSWNTIAKMFLVSRWTILRRVNEYNLYNLRRFSDISDNDLNELVRTILREHGNFVGFSLVYGHLESMYNKCDYERV